MKTYLTSRDNGKKNFPVATLLLAAAELKPNTYLLPGDAG